MCVCVRACIVIFIWRNSPHWAIVSSFTRFLDHTQRRTTVGTTPLDEWSARRRDLYLTTHSTHNRQTSMPPVGFEPTILAGEQPQTYALDRAATGTGVCLYIYISLRMCIYSRHVLYLCNATYSYRGKNINTHFIHLRTSFCISCFSSFSSLYSLFFSAVSLWPFPFPVSPLPCLYRAVYNRIFFQKFCSSH